MSDELARWLGQRITTLERKTQRLEAQEYVGGTATGGGGTAVFNDAAGDPSNVGTAAVDGVSNYAARLDHVHAFSRSVMFSDAEGDPLTVGTAAASDGTSTYAARRDHLHTLDFSRPLMFSDAEGNPAATSGASAPGTSTYASRRDHVHASSGSISGTALTLSVTNWIRTGYGSEGTPAYSFTGAPDTGFITYSNRIGIVTAGTERVQIGTAESRFHTSTVLEGLAYANAGLYVTGTADVQGTAPTLNVGDSGLDAQAATLRVGNGRTGSGYAYVDLIGDTTYSDYGLRLVRYNTGANALSKIVHHGTGVLAIETTNAASIQFNTVETARLTIGTAGPVAVVGSSPVLNVGDSTLSSGTAALNIGQGRTNAGTSCINLIAGTAPYNEYGLRIERASGDNGTGRVIHRGTGALSIETNEAAALQLKTSATTRVEVASTGATTVSAALTATGTLGVGSSGTGKIKHAGGGFALATNAVATYLPNRFVGLILAMDNYAGCCLINSTFSTLTIISNPGSTWSVTKDTASKHNIYINASSEIEVQNKTANTTTYRILFIGDNNIP